MKMPRMIKSMRVKESKGDGEESKRDKEEMGDDEKQLNLALE